MPQQTLPADVPPGPPDGQASSVADAPPGPPEGHPSPTHPSRKKLHHIPHKKKASLTGSQITEVYSTGGNFPLQASTLTTSTWLAQRKLHLLSTRKPSGKLRLAHPVNCGNKATLGKQASPSTAHSTRLESISHSKRLPHPPILPRRRSSHHPEDKGLRFRNGEPRLTTTSLTGSVSSHRLGWLNSDLPPQRHYRNHHSPH